MEGGKGDDSIASGYSSADTYVFNVGDRKDSIADYGDPYYEDILTFGAGIAASGVTFSRSGNDLTFTLGAGDQVTVRDWFANDYYRIERIKFTDGTSWTAATIRSI